MTHTSIALIWKLYQGFKDDLYCKNLTLQLLHALFPFLTESQNADRDVTETFFKELCNVVDTQEEVECNSGASHQGTTPEPVCLEHINLVPADKLESQMLASLMAETPGKNGQVLTHV